MNISKDELITFGCELLHRYYAQFEESVKMGCSIPLEFEKDYIYLCKEIDEILKEMKIKQTCECKVPEIVDLFTNPHCKKCGAKTK